MELEPFYKYFMITKTLIMSHKKCESVYMYQYPPRKLSKSLWENNIHTPKYERKILWQLFIFIELEPFSYYFLTTKKLNLSHVKKKWAYLNQYKTIKYIKGSMGQPYTYSTRWVKNIVIVIHIYGALTIFLLFCDQQDTGSES